MNATQLLAHFDRLAEAPNAVPRLRLLVLDLAARGKLVEQDNSDESSVALVNRLHSHKQELINARQLKKETSSRPVGVIPYKLPRSWTWASLGSLATKLTDGSHNPAPDAGSGLPMLSSKNVLDGDISFSNPTRYLTLSDFEMEDSRTRITPNDVLLTIVGSIGRSAVVPADAPKFALQRSVAVIRTELNPQFLSLQLRCPSIQAFFLENEKGTAQKGVYLGKLSTLPIAIPPMKEQHRIVAKVDELMALCDQLEAAQQERERRRDCLAAASLRRLNQLAADTTSEFQREHARFHLQNLPRLITRPEHIKAMRHTVLNLAVRGKLVPQDSSDESAQKFLLENDVTRKGVASSDRRADIDAQELLEHELCWDVPTTWAWRGLADLALFIDYRGQTPNKVEAGVRLITAKNVKPGFINLHPEEFLTESAYDVWMTRGFPKIGDVLFTTEAPMGNAAVVKLPERFALAQRVINFRLYGAIDPHFLVLQLISQSFQRILDKTATGLTAKGIKASKLKRLPITIPPLAEQHRIVAKVDELMALCDQLEAQLTTTQTDSRRLLDAVLEAALTPA